MYIGYGAVQAGGAVLATRLASGTGQSVTPGSCGRAADWVWAPVVVTLSARQLEVSLSLKPYAKYVAKLF